MRSSINLSVVALALVSGSCAALNAQAATVAYYRFENSPGFLADSSPNANNLTNSGVTQYTLPGVGIGSDFPNPIPLTGAANAHATTFNASTDLLETGNTGSDFLSGNAFTAEAFINFAGIGAGARGAFMNQWDTAGERSWQFSVESGGNLSLITSPNGSATGFTTINSTFSPTVGEDYYAGVAFQTNGVTGGTATFYLKHLATGVLQTETINHTAIAMHYDDRLAIGAIVVNNNSFLGTIDEVRLSDVLLSMDELLIFQTPVPPVPEPSTLGLFACGLALMLRKVRRARS